MAPLPAAFTLRDAEAGSLPYALADGRETAFLGGGVLLTGFGIHLQRSTPPLRPAQIDSAAVVSVQPFDRCATRRWSPRASAASDILLNACLAAPAALVLGLDGRRDRRTAALIYFETLLAAGAVTTITKGAVRRSRPYVYNPNAPEEVKLERNARFSFFSGHTSLAFAASLFTARVYDAAFPDSRWTPWVWSGSLLAAASVGGLRILAGKHYRSDVIAGAVAGTLCGLLVPLVHEKETKTGEAAPLRLTLRVCF